MSRGTFCVSAKHCSCSAHIGTLFSVHLWDTCFYTPISHIVCIQGQTHLLKFVFSLQIVLGFLGNGKKKLPHDTSVFVVPVYLTYKCELHSRILVWWEWDGKK